MRDRLDDLGDRTAGRVSLIGWSLGGIFARDLARRTPDAVRQVITLGSPFRLARRGQSRAARVFDRYSHLHVEHRDAAAGARSPPPLPVPATSIYSHSDGIVHWQTCLDTPGERCENIAVIASHLGLGHHPASIWADRRPPGPARGRRGSRSGRRCSCARPSRRPEPEPRDEVAAANSAVREPPYPVGAIAAPPRFEASLQRGAPSPVHCTNPRAVGGPT